MRRKTFRPVDRHGERAAHAISSKSSPAPDVSMSVNETIGFDRERRSVTIFSITEGEVPHRSGLFSDSPASQNPHAHSGLQGLDAQNARRGMWNDRADDLP
jgi:hypothetical protein